jgi:predicted lipoprotein with Yx(FWY)xxD motif
MPMLPADAGTTKGNNGMVQFTWKKMPLYRFAQDKKPGDVSGQGLGGVWSVVKM